jgi:hypothetical protein
VRWLLLLALAASLLFAADPLADSAQKKLDSISDQKLKRGAVVTLSQREINAWIQEKAIKAFPQGMRNENIVLGPGTADGTALVDLTKLSKSNSVNPLIARLIDGERPLRVAIRVESSSGKCTVFLTHVELSGVAIDGSILDFLIKHFVQPRYPDIKINEPFDLDFNMDRIELQPSGARVAIKK